MHVRLSTCLGMPVVEDGEEYALGTISGALIHPDKAHIEGFFVHCHGLLGSEEHYCSALDIVRWGTRVYVGHADALGPAEDRIRLQALLNDPRTVLHQRITTQAGRHLGRCRDVQFNTETMRIEWLFPRKFWRWGVALPVTEVVEVTPQSIVVRSQVKPAKQLAEPVADVDPALAIDTPLQS